VRRVPALPAPSVVSPIASSAIADTQHTKRIHMTNQQTVDFDGPIGPSMSEFSADYMTYVESHLDEDLTHVADRILALLRSMESLTQGFAITQLQHSLQTATRAERGGADLDMIVASLCHDIGKTISNANHPAIAA